MEDRIALRLPPDLARVFTGCPFGPRCDWSVAACHDGVPPLAPVAGGAPAQAAACIRAADVTATPPTVAVVSP